jgi:hypothetical protein
MSYASEQTVVPLIFTTLSLRRQPLWVDTVEKVGCASRVRNYRIGNACRSNQCCVGDWFFESKLCADGLKIFFQQYRSN